MELVASLLCVAAIVVLAARAVRQRAALKPLTPASPRNCPKVTVVVPARNEADAIETCLEGLLSQRYPEEQLKIIAVDDGSWDATPELLAALARRHARLSVIRNPPLSAGWTGKSQACWTAVSALDPDTDFVCFIDADMEAQPMLIVSAVAAALQRGLALVTLAPTHHLVSFAERLMIPIGLIYLSFTQDLARLRSPSSPRVSANGQFMLVNLSAYWQVGGHAAARDAICEDAALASRLRKAGFSIEMMDGSALIATRMYTGFASLWEGFGRNVTETLGGPAKTLAGVLMAAIFSWIVVALPVVDAISFFGRGSDANESVALVLALLCLAAVLGFHFAAMRHFRIPAWYALLFPLGYSLGAALAIDAVLRRIDGRGVRWKGRVYS